MAEELKEVEIPLGKKVVLLRPKEGFAPSRENIRKILNYINECFFEVKGTEQPLIVFIPSIIDVISIDVDGKVEVH